jgi:hypothetical protein
VIRTVYGTSSPERLLDKVFQKECGRQKRAEDSDERGTEEQEICTKGEKECVRGSVETGVLSGQTE